MNFFSKLAILFAFLLVTATSYSQVPDPNGGYDWDFCPCTVGIQSYYDVCPCAQVFPPIPVGSTTTPTGTEPEETGSGSTYGIPFFEFLAWIRCIIDPDCV